MTSTAVADAAGRAVESAGGAGAALRDLACLASTLEPGAAAVAVTSDWGTLPLPGRPAGRLLGERPAVIEQALALLAARRSRMRFLYDDPLDGWLAVTIMRAPGCSVEGSDCAIVVERRTALPYGLTPRELDVLTLLSRGSTNGEIAAELVTSRRTVSTHVEHILEKLGLGSRAGVAALAVEEGLVRLLPQGRCTR